MARFSIITATYNLLDNGRKDSFEQAVESVRAQSHGDVEHIVVDGASDDGTTPWLRDLHARGLFDVLISEPDSGVYEAMNRGAQAASGDFVMFLNSDDFYHDPDGLAALDRLADRDFIASPVVHRLPGGDRLRRVSRGYARMLWSMPFWHPGLAVRRDLFHRLGGFDLRYPIASDYDFILRMFWAGAKGRSSDRDFVTFLDGGLSSDVRRTDAEKVSVWKNRYTRYVELPDEQWERAMKLRVAPLKLCLALLSARRLPLTVRRSALVQLLRTLMKGAPA